jgi:hypothetical protein
LFVKNETEKSAVVHEEMRFISRSWRRTSLKLKNLPPTEFQDTSSQDIKESSAKGTVFHFCYVTDDNGTHHSGNFEWLDIYVKRDLNHNIESPSTFKIPGLPFYHHLVIEDSTFNVPLLFTLWNYAQRSCIVSYTTFVRLWRESLLWSHSASSEEDSFSYDFVFILTLFLNSTTKSLYWWNSFSWSFVVGQVSLLMLLCPSLRYPWKSDSVINLKK